MEKMNNWDCSDISAALACHDAYIFLRKKVEETLSMLHANNIREAEENLTAALSFSRMIFNESCDLFFLDDD